MRATSDPVCLVVKVHMLLLAGSANFGATPEMLSILLGAHKRNPEVCLLQCCHHCEQCLNSGQLVDMHFGRHIYITLVSEPHLLNAFKIRSDLTPAQVQSDGEKNAKLALKPVDPPGPAASYSVSLDVVFAHNIVQVQADGE